MTGRGYWLILSCSPFAPVSSTGTGFDSSPIKGEGDSVGWFGLLYARPVDTALKPV